MRNANRDAIAMRALALAGFVLALTVATGWTVVGATGRSPLQNRPVAPTLARLSFWVSPQRMSEFEAAYRAKVAPILKRHGLTESSERGRAAPDSIFSRLFEMKTPLEVEEKQQALQGDATWTALLQSLGTTFGTPQPNGRIRNAFLIYVAPAGPGKTVPAGPGKSVPAGPGTGQWRTYDATMGMAGFRIRSITQDREGNLWFGTFGSGVIRYDGKTFTAFTVKDGLANDHVGQILQDREGSFWFGTSQGVSRYDGKEWTTFTKKDGLGLNDVFSNLQDREGNLWFGGDGP